MKDFLTTAEVSRLKAQHVGEKNRKVCDRIKAVLMANNGWTQEDIADALLLSEGTIGLHLKRLYRSGKVTFGKRWVFGKRSQSQTNKRVD